jgi:hypothetical protein
MTQEQKKWYDNKVLTNILLVVFFPVGLYALWKSNTIAKWWKITATIIIGLIVITNIGDGTKNDVTSSNSNVEQEKEKEKEKEKVKDTVPAEYKSALNKATSYANTMHMSKLGVYDQLVSEYGEKFSTEAAQYAVDNVNADWNANALAKAKTYQDTMNMSPASIHDQLTSEYGEKFTQAEADYAIQHLND